MTATEHAQLIFDAAIAAHSTACRAARTARREGAPDAVHHANRDRRRAAHGVVQAAYAALIATY